MGLAIVQISQRENSDLVERKYDICDVYFGLGVASRQGKSRTLCLYYTAVKL